MINRQQDPRSKREEEFNWAVLQAKKDPEILKNSTPEVQEAVKNQNNFSANRKKYLGK